MFIKRSIRGLSQFRQVRAGQQQVYGVVRFIETVIIMYFVLCTDFRINDVENFNVMIIALDSPTGYILGRLKVPATSS